MKGNWSTDGPVKNNDLRKVKDLPLVHVCPSYSSPKNTKRPGRDKTIHCVHAEVFWKPKLGRNDKDHDRPLDKNTELHTCNQESLKGVIKTDSLLLTL